MTMINLNAIGWQDVTVEKSGDDEQKNNAPVNADAAIIPTTNVITIAGDAQSRIAEAEKFFNLLYCKLPAQNFIYLTTKHEGTFAFDTADAEQIKAMARKAIEMSDSGVEYVWHCVNPVSIKPSNGKRGSEDVVSYQTAIVTDIDIAGDAHKGENLAESFDEAKSFLPFTPSIIVDSGFGLHAYYLFDEPITITEDNREELRRRNKLLLAVIKQRANGKKIDGVGDLPRVLRTPGTINHKVKDDLRPCRIVEVNDVRYTPDELDEKLNALYIPPPKTAETVKTARASKVISDDPEYDIFRARRMLDSIRCSDLNRNDWLAVMSACKNIGVDYSVVDDFNRSDPDRYNNEENMKTWNSLHENSFRIETLHGIAKRFAYSENSVWHEYHQPRADSAGFAFSENSDSAASSSSKLAQLQAELATVNAEMKAFETERDNAIERLKNLQQFGHKDVFAPEIITAAAICTAFNETILLAGTRHEIKNYGDLHPKERANLNAWGTSINTALVPFARKLQDLEQRRKNLIAEIETVQFAEQCADTKVFDIPFGFYIKAGVVMRRQEGKKPDVVVARRPVYFVGKFYNVDDQIHSVQLAVMDDDKKLHKLPLVDKATTADRGKIIALANHGLPVSSATATELVGYLDAFYIANESKIPMSYIVNRCGWHKINGTEIFIDPRRDCTETGKNIPVVVDRKSQFAQSLTTAGNIDEWKRAYSVAKKSPVARLIVAACVAAPLLKILHERNFMLYIHAKTRAGKTTALMLGASAVGSEKIVRSFDATQNGLIGAAADVNDYAFLIDEKQVINPKLREQLSNLVYGLSNGIGKTRLNRDISNRKVQDWRTITIATGETEFLDDNATGGAHTRLLSIKAPETILSAEDCKTIRQTIADNYGHAMPLVIDKIIDVGKSTLIEMFDDLVNVLQSRREDLLSEHCRYLSVLAIGDYLLNAALSVADETALKDALTATVDVLPLVPTRAEIDDTARERDFVLNFIAQNQSRFIGGSVALNRMQSVYGKLGNSDDSGDKYTYVIAAALKAECQRFGYDYRKLVDDLIADGFFVPSNVVKKGHKQPLKTVQRRIGEANATCYRMPIERTADDAEEAL